MLPVDRGAQFWRGRERADKVGVERDRVGLDLVEERLDLALAARFLILEGVGLGAVEVGFSGPGDEDARDASGVPDREDVLEWAEADGGERAVGDWMG